MRSDRARSWAWSGSRSRRARPPSCGASCPRPALRQIQAIGDGQARVVVGERQRDHDLAVLLLAELAAILMRHADRMGSALGKASVVDDPGLDRRRAARSAAAPSRAPWPAPPRRTTRPPPRNATTPGAGRRRAPAPSPLRSAQRSSVRTAAAAPCSSRASARRAPHAPSLSQAHRDSSRNALRCAPPPPPATPAAPRSR